MTSIVTFAPEKRRKIRKTYIASNKLTKFDMILDEIDERSHSVNQHTKRMDAQLECHLKGVGLLMEMGNPIVAHVCPIDDDGHSFVWADVRITLASPIAGSFKFDVVYVLCVPSFPFLDLHTSFKVSTMEIWGQLCSQSDTIITLGELEPFAHFNLGQCFVFSPNLVKVAWVTIDQRGVVCFQPCLLGRR